MRWTNRILGIVGPIGYTGKAFLYGTIGVLTMMSALAYRREDTNDESPQGIFLLLSNVGGVTGLILMLVLFGCMVCYILWRVLEAFMVQTTPNLEQVSTRLRRFFRYRFSPLVSATIYAAYAFFLIDVIIKRRQSDTSTCFPMCWHDHTWGIALLALLGIAFLIGSFTQLEMAYSMDYIRELKPAPMQNPLLRTWMLFSGSLGHIGRALLFGLIAISMFLFAAGRNIWTDPNHGTLGQSLNHWVTHPGGRAFLFITGLFLFVFAVFVGFCICLRTFPTHFRNTNSN